MSGADASYRWPWVAIVFFVAVGVAVASVSMVSFASVRSSLDAISGDGSAEPYTPILHRRLQTILVAASAFCFFVAAASFSFVATQRGKIAAVRMTNYLQAFSGNLWLDFWRLVASLKRVLTSSRWLILFSIAIACVVRLPFVQTPIRFDEAISWRDYAAKPFWLTIALYNDPNNHVFHNLLSGSLTKCFGESLFVLRGVSVTAGILIVAVSAVTTKRILFTWLSESDAFLATVAGFITAIALCSNPMLNEFSIYARGYSLLTLLWLLSVLLLQHAIGNRNSASWIGSIAFGSLGMWTIPIMVYPVIATVVFWLLSRSRLVDVGTWLASIALVTIALYSPILAISGPQAIVGNSYVRSLSLSSWIQQAPTMLYSYRSLLAWNMPASLHSSLQGMSQGVMTAIVVSACYFLKDYRRLGLKSMIALVAVAAVVLVQRVVPPERTWVWLLIPLSIALGVAIPTVAKANFRNVTLSAIASCVVAIVIFAFPAIDWFSGNTLRNSMAIGPCPEASDAVSSLMQSRRSNEAIVVVCPASGTFDWYAKRAGIESKAFDPPEFDSESSRSEFGSSTNSIIVGVVNDSQFKQTVTSVLDAQASTRPWIGGVEELLWQGETLALYRVWIGK